MDLFLVRLKKHFAESGVFGCGPSALLPSCRPVWLGSLNPYFYNGMTDLDPFRAGYLLGCLLSSPHGMIGEEIRRERFEDVVAAAPSEVAVRVLTEVFN